MKSVINKTFLWIVLCYVPINRNVEAVQILNVETNLAWYNNLWRQEQLESICDNLEMSSKKLPPVSNLSHLLVDHKHKLLYCYVPKVACTNWKRIFMILSGKSNNTDLLTIPGHLAHAPGSVSKLSDLSEQDAYNCLKNYTKFVMVRHPFERLLSAYRNKLESRKWPSSKYFQERVGKYIIKHYRYNNTNTSVVNNGDDVTFAEFVQYVITEGHNNPDQNEHWKPISQMCHPCTISYDVIGKYESLVEDSDMILSMVNASFMNFPVTRTADTSKKLIFYFRQLSLKHIKQLYHLYELDFKTFGYSLENIIGFDIG